MALIDLSWLDTDGQNSAIAQMGASEIVRVFRPPDGFVPALFGVMEGREENVAGIETLYVAADVDGPGAKRDLSDVQLEGNLFFEIPHTEGETLGGSAMNFARNKVTIIAPATDVYPATTTVNVPIPVTRNLIFVKDAAATWLIRLEYMFIKGKMNFIDEQKDYLEDIHQVARQSTRGTEFHQVGDVFQIGRRSMQTGGSGT